MLSSFPDLTNTFDSLDRCLHKFTIVSDRYIAAFLELERGVLWSYISVSAMASSGVQLTIVISFPCAFLNAFVHRTLRGFRFILSLSFNNGLSRISLIMHTWNSYGILRDNCKTESNNTKWNLLTLMYRNGILLRHFLQMPFLHGTQSWKVRYYQLSSPWPGYTLVEQK